MEKLRNDEVRERARRGAAGLRALGVAAGDRVALVLRNSARFFEVSLAAGWLNAWAVPLNWHATPDELAYLVQDCGARVVVDASFEWDALVDAHEPLAEIPRITRPAMIYTSGTTGQPRAVRREAPTAEQAAVAARNRAIVFGAAPGDRVVTVLATPLYHQAPNAFAHWMLRVGADIYLMDKFDAEGLLDAIERHAVTHLCLTPTLFVRLLQLPEAVRAKYDVRSLRHVVHVGAPCAEDVKRRMIAWWGPVIGEYYGSTELTATTFCSSQEWLLRPGTVGRALEGVTLRLVDGEVAARVETAADFTYHGDEAARREADREGYVSLGDLGYLDADGYLFLRGRTRDVINSGGVKIYAAEVEEALRAVAGAECAVFGMPDLEFGEVVCAVVETSEEMSADALRAALRARIAGYRIPKRIVFRAELPRTDSGKVLKHLLRELYSEECSDGH